MTTSRTCRGGYAALPGECYVGLAPTAHAAAYVDLEVRCLVAGQEWNEAEGGKVAFLVNAVKPFPWPCPCWTLTAVPEIRFVFAAVSSEPDRGLHNLQPVPPLGNTNSNSCTWGPCIGLCAQCSLPY